MPKSTTLTLTRRARELVTQANTARERVVIDLTGDSDDEPSASNSNRITNNRTETTTNTRTRQAEVGTYHAINTLQQRKRVKATRRPAMNVTAMRVII